MAPPNDVQTQIDQGPPAGTGTGTGPIGIPTTYVPPTRPGTGAPTPFGQHSPQGPRTLYGTTPNDAIYKDGDEWGPGNNPASEIVATQRLLVQAGVLSATNFRPGVWDTASASAYRTVLAFANATGTNAVDAMQILVTNPQMQQRGRTAPFQLTAPADVLNAVSNGGPGTTNVAQQLTGMDLPKAEQGDFLKWYQDQEDKARSEYMAADLAGPGNTYTGAPNVNDAAQAYIKEHNLAQTVAYGTASRMLTFFQLLHGVVPQ